MLFDETCHNGENVMDYEASSLESTLEANTDMSISEEEDSDQNKANLYHSTEVKRNEDSNAMEDDDDPAWEDKKDCSTEYKYIEEEDNEINMEVYNTEDLNENGLQKSKQAGVLHLVHKWIQQGHPDEVCATGYIGLLFSPL